MAFFGALNDTALFQSPNAIVPVWPFLPPTRATGYGFPVAATWSLLLSEVSRIVTTCWPW